MTVLTLAWQRCPSDVLELSYFFIGLSDTVTGASRWEVRTKKKRLLLQDDDRVLSSYLSLSWQGFHVLTSLVKR